MGTPRLRDGGIALRKELHRSKQYGAPKVFELGSAEVLTLGTKGCESDCKGCDLKPAAEAL